MSGYFLTWFNTAYVLVCPPIVLTILMSLLPETPYWLIEKGQEDLAA